MLTKFSLVSTEVYIFEPSIEQITISEPVAVISNEMWSLVSQMKTIPHWNLYILNHQQLYQIKWEEDELGTTSSETRTITSSCNYIWCGTLVCVKSNWLQIFERITLSELTSSTQTSFSQMYEMQMFQAHCKNSIWNANILDPNVTISNRANFDLIATLWVQQEFVRASCNYSAQVPWQ